MSMTKSCPFIKKEGDLLDGKLICVLGISYSIPYVTRTRMAASVGTPGPTALFFSLL